MPLLKDLSRFENCQDALGIGVVVKCLHAVSMCGVSCLSTTSVTYILLATYKACIDSTAGQFVYKKGDRVGQTWAIINFPFLLTRPLVRVSQRVNMSVTMLV